MKFDVIATNPPFQDRLARKRTPHKLWLDFTSAAFERWLVPGGLLLQVSPASLQSPSSRALKLMRTRTTELINFDVAHHFPGVGSSFAYYAVRNDPAAPAATTTMVRDGVTFSVTLDDDVLWLPVDLCDEALAIHRKVMWSHGSRLPVEHDYVTCHNITLGKTLSKVETPEHPNPVFHTNAQTWWASLHRPWFSSPKVMWTRSGYTKPFCDPGALGGTDMAYFVQMPTVADAENLAHNLNLPLFRYIFRTAKWSGFGNEVVFANLPHLPHDRRLTDDEVCDVFGLTREERDYVRRYLG